MCYKVKLVVHYSTCAIKFWLVPGFSQKRFRIFPKFFFSIEMKIKLKSALYVDFWLVSKRIWSRNSHWNKTSTQTFHRITYNTIILSRRVIKFLDFNFLNISKVLTFSDYILSFVKARNKIKSKKARTFSIKRKFLSKT